MKAARTLSRRALLVGGNVPPAERLPPLFPPPWAVDALAFYEKCTRCNACIDACPERVLRRDGNGFAAFDAQLGECSFCAECVSVCETGALDRNMSAPWSLVADIVSAQCLNAQGVVCATCADACPERAIRIPLQKRAEIQVDINQCTGCGACVSVCPVQAVALHDASKEPA